MIEVELVQGLEAAAAAPRARRGGLGIGIVLASPGLASWSIVR